MANQPSFTATPVSNAVSFVNADGTGLKTLRTYGASGGVTEHLRISSSDTSARNVLVYINLGGSDLMIANVAVALGSATNPTNVDALAAIYTFVEKQFIKGKASALLKVGMAVAVTAATTVWIYEDGGDY
jgi:hypothetical protein